MKNWPVVLGMFFTFTVGYFMYPITHPVQYAKQVVIQEVKESSDGMQKAAIELYSAYKAKKETE